LWHFLTVHPTILDTDIGTDVDDLLALALLAQEPAAQLCGITTVHGDTTLRAQVARYSCNLLGHRSIPIVPGESETLTGRPIDWKGHEGQGVPGLATIPVETGVSAPDFLIQQAAQFSGALEIVAIGPLTNLARAISRDPAFKKRVKTIYLMGGAYYQPWREHNVLIDPEAARIVFDSGIPMDVLGLDVTLQVAINEVDLPRLQRLPNGLGDFVVSQIRRWWEFLGHPWCCLHDPLAALAMFEPEHFVFERLAVAVSEDGLIQAKPDPSSRIRVAKTVNKESAKAAILDRICGRVSR
jgi:purine nucleosidase